MVADGSLVTEGIVPQKAGSIAAAEYAVLSRQPYELPPRQLFVEVHHVHRRRPHLKCASYPLAGMELPKRFGWGVHVNPLGKVGLVACDSEEYREMLHDPYVKKCRSWCSSKA
nr:DUF6157 family protein [uncultured Desulfobulbus sp.]